MMYGNKTHAKHWKQYIQGSVEDELWCNVHFRRHICSFWLQIPPVFSWTGSVPLWSEISPPSSPVQVHDLGKRRQTWSYATLTSQSGKLPICEWKGAHDRCSGTLVVRWMSLYRDTIVIMEKILWQHCTAQDSPLTFVHSVLVLLRKKLKVKYVGCIFRNKLSSVILNIKMKNSWVKWLQVTSEGLNRHHSFKTQKAYFTVRVFFVVVANTSPNIQPSL